uniref:Lambda-crystallin-like n=1 Tax=Phallusia mammillata TaxID=59560 RepID=A0A6F9DAN3_9ASCI|nr:lambda-crystallin-like [Phallusia mammillata]
MENSQKKVGIIGSGLIGRSWAMLFAGAGYTVKMYDVLEEQLQDAMISIRGQITDLESQGLLRGSLSADVQCSLITTSNNIADVVKDAVHIQECVPENIDLKKKVLKSVSDACTSNSTVICSSTSCILPSKIFSHLPRVGQCIVAHPCNPPYHCPLTEIVPHPQTEQSVIIKTKAIMAEIGQTPVMLNREVDGFGLNRIQYAILNESWRLVEDGIMSPEDVDKIFTDGLGMRYAFIGPYQTIHLNAEGTKNYMERYSESIIRVSKSFGPVPTFDGKSLNSIHESISSEIPSTPADLEKKRKWRDERLVALSKLKQEMDKQ